MSNFIGNLGEIQVYNFLREHKFLHVFVFQNRSGQGLDIVGMRKYKDFHGNTQRYIVSIEVKTTTTDGAGPRLSEAQRNPYLNTGRVLIEAATGTGRFISVDSPHLQRAAKFLIAAIADGVPMYQAHARLHISIGGTTTTTTHNERVRVHGFGDNSRRPLFDTKLPRRRR